MEITIVPLHSTVLKIKRYTRLVGLAQHVALKDSSSFHYFYYLQCCSYQYHRNYCGKFQRGNGSGSDLEEGFDVTRQACVGPSGNTCCVWGNREPRTLKKEGIRKEMLGWVLCFH